MESNRYLLERDAILFPVNRWDKEVVKAGRNLFLLYFTSQTFKHRDLVYCSKEGAKSDPHSPTTHPNPVGYALWDVKETDVYVPVKVIEPHVLQYLGSVNQLTLNPPPLRIDPFPINLKLDFSVLTVMGEKDWKPPIFHIENPIYCDYCYRPLLKESLSSLHVQELCFYRVRSSNDLNIPEGKVLCRDCVGLINDDALHPQDTEYLWERMREIIEDAPTINLVGNKYFETYRTKTLMRRTVDIWRHRLETEYSEDAKQGLVQVFLEWCNGKQDNPPQPFTPKTSNLHIWL